jgi:dCMP deaminase
VVSADNSTVLGLGYNGSAKGLPNGCLSDEPGKCGHIHAEINALIKTNYRDASFKKAYLTLSPCYNCSIALINAGIGEVIYKTAYRDQSGLALLSEAGVKVRQFPAQGVPERYLQERKDG